MLHWSATSQDSLKLAGRRGALFFPSSHEALSPPTPYSPHTRSYMLHRATTYMLHWTITSRDSLKLAVENRSSLLPLILSSPYSPHPLPSHAATCCIGPSRHGTRSSSQWLRGALLFPAPPDPQNPVSPTPYFSRTHSYILHWTITSRDALKLAVEERSSTGAGGGGWLMLAWARKGQPFPSDAIFGNLFGRRTVAAFTISGPGAAGAQTASFTLGRTAFGTTFNGAVMKLPGVSPIYPGADSLPHDLQWHCHEVLTPEGRRGSTGELLWQEPAAVGLHHRLLRQPPSQHSILSSHTQFTPLSIQPPLQARFTRQRSDGAVPVSYYGRNRLLWAYTTDSSANPTLPPFYRGISVVDFSCTAVGDVGNGDSNGNGGGDSDSSFDPSPPPPTRTPSPPPASSCLGSRKTSCSASSLPGYTSVVTLGKGLMLHWKLLTTTSAAFCLQAKSGTAAAAGGWVSVAWSRGGGMVPADAVIGAPGGAAKAYAISSYSSVDPTSRFAITGGSVNSGFNGVLLK
ncbi:unnamed protein product [Closterium sp. Naga37s-1]|nr:unnamed protein product [Closterium sp. Naga37s-1]